MSSSRLLVLPVLRVLPSSRPPVLPVLPILHILPLLPLLLSSQSSPSSLSSLSFRRGQRHVRRKWPSRVDAPASGGYAPVIVFREHVHTLGCSGGWSSHEICSLSPGADAGPGARSQSVSPPCDHPSECLAPADTLPDCHSMSTCNRLKRPTNIGTAAAVSGPVNNTRPPTSAQFISETATHGANGPPGRRRRKHGR